MIIINPLGETEIRHADGSYELIGTITISELASRLGREPTLSDFDHEFTRQARRAIRNEVDWRVYRRYMELADAGYDDGHSLTRVCASTTPTKARPNGEPEVWLTRGIWVPTGEPAPTPPEPWHVEFIDIGGDEYDEYEATLSVIYMHSGDICRHALALEQYLETLNERHQEVAQ